MGFTPSRTVPVLLLSGLLVTITHGAELEQPGRHALLDVPYVSQTPELCGGAAVAMVLRYWGMRDVFAEDFAPLVSRADEGILTGTLISAVRDGGWQAHRVVAGFETARAAIRAELDRGRPLIALVAVTPRTYHYVVVVGSTDQEVVLHDPARAPYQVLAWADFDRAWAATGRWMLLVLPPVEFQAGKTVATFVPPGTDAAVTDVKTPCTPLVEHAVRLAHSGYAGESERRLVAATGLCPTDAAVWRELAGLRFAESRWPEAQAFARTAVGLAPGDEHAWQIMAASEYLMHNPSGALEAWNHTGEPRLAAINSHGATRTRQPVIVRATGLRPRQVLTPEALARSRRRLAELPVAFGARVRYEPGLVPEDAGQATVDAYINERPLVPSGRLALAVMGARALLVDEVGFDLAGPLGAGEMTSSEWRWSAGRPRVAVRLAIPAPDGLPGIVSFTGSWERQSFGPAFSSGNATLVREERRRVGLQVAEWATSWLHWQAGTALDRFADSGPRAAGSFDIRRYISAEGLLDVRLAGDRVSLAVSGGWWTPLTTGRRFGTGQLRAAWRSTSDRSRSTWSAVADMTVAGQAAPLTLWPGAGTGRSREGFLRAHPLLDGGGAVVGPVFGRRVGSGSVEYAHPVGSALGTLVSIAGFADMARAWHRSGDLGASPLLVDVGAGGRVHAPGLGGSLRIDLAHGLRGGGPTFSAGWATAWPH